MCADAAAQSFEDFFRNCLDAQAESAVARKFGRSLPGRGCGFLLLAVLLGLLVLLVVLLAIVAFTHLSFSSLKVLSCPATQDKKSVNGDSQPRSTGLQTYHTAERIVSRPWRKSVDRPVAAGEAAWFDMKMTNRLRTETGRNSLAKPPAIRKNAGVAGLLCDRPPERPPFNGNRDIARSQGPGRQTCTVYDGGRMRPCVRRGFRLSCAWD
jgi:hypothetical protein